jgi:hypothetical protein
MKRHLVFSMHFHSRITVTVLDCSNRNADFDSRYSHAPTKKGHLERWPLVRSL